METTKIVLKELEQKELDKIYGGFSKKSSGRIGERPVEGGAAFGLGVCCNLN